MGAQQFVTKSAGSNVDDAFKQACAWARYAYGSDGYTGSIAEKDNYVLFDVPTGTTAEEFAELIAEAEWSSAGRESLADLIGGEDVQHVVDAFANKWGPAVALRVSEGEWLFCGWASS